MTASGAKPSGKTTAVQARGNAIRVVLLAMLGMLLTGCAESSGPLDPVSWWHDIAGGPIVAKRPIPGQNAPYPNLADVPQPPRFTTAAERTRISAGLLADRAQAHREMLLVPLAPAAKPAPSPSPPPAGAPAAEASGAGAQLAAVSAPANPKPAEPSGPKLAPATVSEALALLPSVPSAPPPPPAIAGFRPPAPPPAALALARGAAVPLAFTPGSSALTKVDRARLAALASRRGSARLAVLGYGDARASDGATQAAALRLGLARAHAVATALAAAGVPLAALSIGAEASGLGASVRLVGGA